MFTVPKGDLMSAKHLFASGFQVEPLMAEARRTSTEAGRRVEPLARTRGQVLRRIILLPGEELPYRRNPHLEKVWRVQSGAGHADIDEAEIALMPQAEITIAAGALHQIENRGTRPLVLLELRRLGDCRMEFHWPDLGEPVAGSA